MELINNLINELDVQNTNLSYMPNIIKEINHSVKQKLIFTLNKYINNKYSLLGSIVQIGFNLEKTFISNNKNILSQQMNFFSSLVNPIISEMKNICLQLNVELVNDFKEKINELIEINQEKYSNVKKNIKFLQINCFCRNINYVVGKDMSFDDFGIRVKISNSHYKEYFKEIINEFCTFSLNKNTHDKRFDWYWKAVEHCQYDNNCCNITNITNNDNEKLNFQNDSLLQEMSVDNEEIVKKYESFKIIQKEPEQTMYLNNTNSSDTKINILDASDEQIPKSISRSLVIEDDSFTIPIDNTNISNIAD